jgi:DNA-binding GntR family transcriptional regulator
LPSSPEYVRIADQVADDIASGLLHPGDRLPAISQLAEQYEVSQAVVKSALLVLSTRGLVYGPEEGRIFVRGGSATARTGSDEEWTDLADQWGGSGP